MTGEGRHLNLDLGEGSLSHSQNHSSSEKGEPTVKVDIYAPRQTPPPKIDSLKQCQAALQVSVELQTAYSAKSLWKA